MVAWFIIALATLAVFAFIAVSGVQTVAMTTDAAGRIETVRRLDAAVNALLVRAAPANGDNVVFLPVGSANPSGQGYGLPADLANMSQTPFGQRFVYCPFGASGGTGTSATVTSPNGSSYAIAVRTHLGKDYVVGGRPSYPQLGAQPNLIGYVMAPRSKLSGLPSCDQVIYNPTTRKFEAPDAIVRPLTREAGVDEARTVSSREVTYFVAPSGTGTGASASDPASFSAALAFYRTRLPVRMTINMATGYYTYTPAEFSLDPTARRSDLTLRHTDGGAGQVDIDLQSGGVITQIPLSGRLTLSGVNFDSETVLTILNGDVLTMINSVVGGIRNNGGSAIMHGTNALTLGGATNWAYGGVGSSILNLAPDSTLTLANQSRLGLNVRGGAQIKAERATLNFGVGVSGYSAGVGVDSGSAFSCSFCAINFPTPVSNGLLVQGDLALNDSNLSFGGATSTGITTYRGSRVDLRTVQLGLGVRPTIGVADGGSSVISGDNTTIFRGTTCWSGDIFSESPAGNPGANSGVAANIAVTPLPAAPNGTQIQAYADARSVNAARAVKRQVNSSSWACAA